MKDVVRVTNAERHSAVRIARKAEQVVVRRACKSNLEASRRRTKERR